MTNINIKHINMYQRWEMSTKQNKTKKKKSPTSMSPDTVSINSNGINCLTPMCTLKCEFILHFISKFFLAHCTRIVFT